MIYKLEIYQEISKISSKVLHFYNKETAEKEQAKYQQAIELLGLLALYKTKLTEIKVQE